MTCKDHQYRQKSNIRQILVQVQEDTQSFIMCLLALYLLAPSDILALVYELKDAHVQRGMTLNNVFACNKTVDVLRPCEG